MTATEAAGVAAAGRLPDFFVVGHSKSGTTALYEMLRAHPRIYMPMKEPWFFVPELHSRFRKSGGVRPDTLAQYMELFAPARKDQRVGEASPSYLRSRDAAGRIAAVKPDARIVAILREPASYLRSLHLQFVRTNVETETDLRRALALEQARRRGERLPRSSPRPQGLLYSENVKYVEQLRRYERALGRERMLVLIYDDFRRDNAATVREVLRFVGVDDDAAPIATVQANPAMAVRNPMLHQAVHELLLGRGAFARLTKRSIKALVPRRQRRAALERVRRRTLAPPPPPDHALMAELRGRFVSEVVALGEYLGRDLVSLWGYDSLG